MPEPDSQPWMPTYWGDLLRDTSDMSTEEFGAYWLLIGHYWCRHRPLEDDDNRLRRLTRLSARRWAIVRPKLEQYFQVADGVWRHKKVDKELAESEKRRSAYAERGRAGAMARWGGDRPDAAAGRPAQHQGNGVHDVEAPKTAAGGQLHRDSQPALDLSDTHGPDAVQEAFDLWNAFARTADYAVAQVLNSARRSSLRQRLKECGGVSGWMVAIGRVGESSFLSGDNRDGWKPDLDFMLSKKHFTKLMEGGFADRGGRRREASDGGDLKGAFDRLDDDIQRRHEDDPDHSNERGDT